MLSYIPQLGARVSGDLVELVRRFHERWGEVKKTVTKRYSAIDKALVKYDPQNLGVASEYGVNLVSEHGVKFGS